MVSWVLTSVVLQVSREDRAVQGALGIVEEGVLLSGRDRVDVAEGEPNQAVGVTILSEGGRNLLGSFDSLRGNSQTSDRDLVLVDIAAGGAAVAVLDVPGSARDLLGSAAARSRVNGLAVPLRRGRLAAEDPQVRRARVEVQVQDLRRGANRYWAEVGGVAAVDGRSSDRARRTTGEARGRDVGDSLLEMGRRRAAVLQVGLVDGQGTVELVVRVADLLDRSLAGPSIVNDSANAGREGNGKTSLSQGCGQQSVGKVNHVGNDVAGFI